jgi:uncharacterized membrane protein
MRMLSVRPSFTMRGRTFKGLRGWSGKPLHPPLTDIPIAAYLFAAVFDVVSYLGEDKGWSHDFYRAASFVLIGGAAVSVLAALTGFADWLTSTEKGTQARRTANAHALAMVTVTGLVLADIAVRVLADWDERSTQVLPMVLSVVAALLVSLGAALGGSLVYDYGFNVETAGDSPVWHPSEADVLPGQKASGGAAAEIVMDSSETVRTRSKSS